MKEHQVTSCNQPDQQRRAFLKRSAALGMLGPSAAGLALQFAAAGEAAAFTAGDYKALVCVFLNGGNDHANTLIPYDTTNYDLYSAIRGGGPGRTSGGIALGIDDLNTTQLTADTSPLTDGQKLALHPSLQKTADLFNTEHKAAILLNVGPLVTPLTQTQYNSVNTALYPRPPKLFSHNDQQSYFLSQGVEGTSVGWGGRMGDLALTSNNQSLLTCISAAGNTVFLSGNDTTRYQITTSGAIKINPWLLGTAGKAALNTLITRSSTHLLENEFSRVTSRSIGLANTITDALNSAPALSTSFDTDGTSNVLADQLKIVARLISARAGLDSNLKRQVFFVSMNGFDLHDTLMSSHPKLLAKVDEALNAFYLATLELGVADKVTAFTASEFGRTLTSNGDGSDHGWGGHHFIVGGAVKGGKFYGTAPHVSITSDDQVGQGRLLPSTGVVQMAATLARWFGVAENELAGIFPNIGNFPTANLGFMN